jgi:hypothetical protein
LPSASFEFDWHHSLCRNTDFSILSWTLPQSSYPGKYFHSMLHLSQPMDSYWAETFGQLSIIMFLFLLQQYFETLCPRVPIACKSQLSDNLAWLQTPAVPKTPAKLGYSTSYLKASPPSPQGGATLLQTSSASSIEHQSQQTSWKIPTQMANHLSTTTPPHVHRHRMLSCDWCGYNDSKHYKHLLRVRRTINMIKQYLQKKVQLGSPVNDFCWLASTQPCRLKLHSSHSTRFQIVSTSVAPGGKACGPIQPQYVLFFLPYLLPQCHWGQDTLAKVSMP